MEFQLVAPIDVEPARSAAQHVMPYGPGQRRWLSTTVRAGAKGVLREFGRGVEKSGKYLGRLRSSYGVYHPLQLDPIAQPWQRPINSSNLIDRAADYTFQSRAAFLSGSQTS